MRDINSVIITGGTGIVGTSIIEFCISHGIRVLVVRRKNSKRAESLPKSNLVNVIEADIGEYVDVCKPKETYDAMIHLAWMGTKENGKNDMSLQLKNVQGTLDAVELAKKCGCKVFLGAGSQAEYGRVNGIISSDTPTFPENGYGMGKLCAGEMSRYTCEQYGIDHIWIRILSLYGENDWSHTVLISAIDAFLNNKKIEFTKGEQLWDFLYCRDAAKIIYRLLKRGKSGEVYCIGSGHSIPLKEYIHQTYIEVMGNDAPDDIIGIGKREYSSCEVMHLEVDISTLVADIGSIEFTPFTTGIRNTINWVKTGRT